MHPLWWLPIDLRRPQCAAMTTSTGLSIFWYCPSVTYEVSLCDDDHPLFLVVWSSAAYRDDRHGRTRIVCDARWSIKLLAVGDDTDFSVSRPFWRWRLSPINRCFTFATLKWDLLQICLPPHDEPKLGWPTGAPSRNWTLDLTIIRELGAASTHLAIEHKQLGRAAWSTWFWQF